MHFELGAGTVDVFMQFHKNKRGPNYVYHHALRKVLITQIKKKYVKRVT